ncbi:hypothetical protein D8S78_02200 [Natrialba swarupiae]|nr:hypothetical protein [Natrialba swarupiae]
MDSHAVRVGSDRDVGVAVDRVHGDPEPFGRPVVDDSRPEGIRLDGERRARIDVSNDRGNRSSCTRSRLMTWVRSQRACAESARGQGDSPRAYQR